MSADKNELFYKLFVRFIQREFERTGTTKEIQEIIVSELISFGHPKEIAQIFSMELTTDAINALHRKKELEQS